MDDRLDRMDSLVRPKRMNGLKVVQESVKLHQGEDHRR
jgi:hypothetical protein